LPKINKYRVICNWYKFNYIRFKEREPLFRWKKRAKNLKNSKEKSAEKSIITQENADKTSVIGIKAGRQKPNVPLLHRSNAKMQLNDSVLQFNQKEEEVEKAKPKELFE
jgi:hypothetical protein